ncbi:MAG TPA: Hsp20/alpha crystallin family protein [Candidatus Altiarchaeales archaeon]|nr:MAG: hypothetical protein DRO65_00775 [Candidatus Altiarchaeales archaeon]HDN83015.1 Hsp20/alpha crystallin family protein [Candidatus Altiarchaeales archaeon]
MPFPDFEDWFIFDDDYFIRNALHSRYVEPVTDIFETDDEIIVTMELPGVEEKDIEIKLSQHSLEVIARKLKQYDEICRRYQVERDFDGYYKFLKFVPEIDTKNYKKTYVNGVLEIRLKKKTNKKIRVA